MQWMSVIGFRSLSLSGATRSVASSNVFRHFSPPSEPQDSFTPIWTHSLCHRNSKTSVAKIELRPPKLRPTILRAMAKTSATTELYGRPFSACYTPQTAHSLTGNESYYRRYLRSGHSSIPSPRGVPVTASFVSNVVNRCSVPPGAHLGSRQTHPRTSRNSLGQKTKLQLCQYRYPK